MQQECTEAAKEECHGGLECLGCLTEKALCFANPVTIAESILKCVPPFVLFNPLACPEQWVNNYALHCVEGLFQCVPERPHPVVFTESGNVRGLTRSYKKNPLGPSMSQVPVDMFWGITHLMPS